MSETLTLLDDESPFAVLGITPTLDPGKVKRAWFAGLARHPPHDDSAAFRRLRSAYEALTRPGGLVLAFAASPIDSVAELARWNDRFAAAVASAAEEAEQANTKAMAVTRFVERLSKLTLVEAITAFTPPRGQG